ncbi:pyridoxine 5'-phosphate synthase [Gammaproteobacteria bacterium]|nr:pyridoxine 5'-phosphate synthase [Gammaproteobacteria bacterium]MDA8861706.1 pyridoxine 5'-phosphate synthase [Gammaproteobacteria bacterium]MDA8999313.1 pyridoxine 5'-phosphate synthase [Gammaproteobacteria bacterium]MDA9041383.1 pyridoxine 5'-phosphate synthase [Gammaproteobacteria bacterium]MDA9220614.1 pyridoxine 5'-phosphate synthase [Gammaproteobacteria bacterium]|tara:strand:- start:835 stop:1605 length:771 start_codon:yes stop_codon:yes gene_type:complete
MKFSLNLNKIALLRNARGENNPSLEEFAILAINLGVDGLTLHPRPDHRHATSDDVISLASLAKSRNIDFNLEGNPFSEGFKKFMGFNNLVEVCQPEQITLVPDMPDQITSDHGWESGDHDQKLRESVKLLKSLSSHSQISLFVDQLKGNKANIDIIDYAQDMGVDGIEIHTGQFSKCIETGDLSIISSLSELISKANSTDLFVNAGHDLNLMNLPELIKIGGVNEVSIGHAVIVDALKNGFEDTIKSYINTIKEQV